MGMGLGAAFELAGHATGNDADPLFFTTLEFRYRRAFGVTLAESLRGDGRSAIYVTVVASSSGSGRGTNLLQVQCSPSAFEACVGCRLAVHSFQPTLSSFA